ncbi:4-aminobutyrate--2-oxoglutarate transaminase [Bacillus lacus]|uniref:(S)-3-amino-2-methylpropionate transaminase n=1 Tax=Metabacillus lacus TaxID=1983721 RepID=A0A7X2J036_9BACI|nr:4-aminobutyrate--2-oxoglutarate transaminase [Metabacillus lacus]MRX72880.1 4-aminobutyrate--2-oxoglutarate transaminase [Metabacillus lacus]
MGKLKKTIEIKTSIPGPNASKLLKLRHEHVPRGPFHTMETFLEEANGAAAKDVDGNVFLDFAGGIGTLNAGHTPKEVVAAIKNQAEKYVHPCFHVMMYEPYIQLAKELNTLAPGDGKKKTFFLSTGAEAVENAVKIARRYTGRKAIVSFERGFHGRTYMAMTLTSKVNPYKNGFGPFVPDVYKLPFPYYYQQRPKTAEEIDSEALQAIQRFFLTEVPPDQIAAFILEPVQGEGGFVIPSSHFVQSIKKICEEHGILLISDEVQTGFGRTGKWFGIEHFGVVPDLITMSKSIAAGVPISAVTGAAHIMDAPAIGEIGGTFGGSPLGCTAALQVIKKIKNEGLLNKAEEIGGTIEKASLQLQEHCSFIGEFRRLGAMAAIEITNPETGLPDKPLTDRILAAIRERGVIIMSAGLYGNVIRFLCPLIITRDQLDEGMDAIKEAFLSFSEN